MQCENSAHPELQAHEFGVAADKTRHWRFRGEVLETRAFSTVFRSRHPRLVAGKLSSVLAGQVPRHRVSPGL